MNGLVISKKDFSTINNDESNITGGKSIRYLFIERILQKKIIDDSWREWIESLASFYMVSNLKMFKTAFPPGWIGKYKNFSKGLKDQIWSETKKEFDIKKNGLTKKEFFLMIRRPPRSTQSRSSAASDVYKRQIIEWVGDLQKRLFDNQ